MPRIEFRKHSLALYRSSKRADLVREYGRGSQRTCSPKSFRGTTWPWDYTETIFRLFARWMDQSNVRAMHNRSNYTPSDVNLTRKWGWAHFKIVGIWNPSPTALMEANSHNYRLPGVTRIQDQEGFVVYNSPDRGQKLLTVCGSWPRYYNALQSREDEVTLGYFLEDLQNELAQAFLWNGSTNPDSVLPYFSPRLRQHLESFGSHRLLPVERHGEVVQTTHASSAQVIEPFRSPSPDPIVEAVRQYQERDVTMTQDLVDSVRDSIEEEKPPEDEPPKPDSPFKKKVRRIMRRR